MSISKESGRVWVQMPADEDMEGGNCSTSFDSIYFLIKKLKVVSLTPRNSQKGAGHRQRV